jgi:Protein of unknown function (DUF4239)
MGDWLLGLPVFWMGVVIQAIIYLYTAAVYLVITKLAVGERAKVFKAVSPGMLPPLSVVFALLVGFLAAQVWTDGQAGNTAVNREASALRTIVLLAATFPGESEQRLRDLVSRHIQDVVSNDWPQMATGRADLHLIPPNLAEALRVSLALNPQTAGQTIAQRELVGAIENALDARRQRIILSHSTINWVKWTALLAQAGLTLIAVAMVHSDNRATNRIILAIFATGVGAAVILIAAHSRPYAGEISVKPGILLQVMPEAGASVGKP